jgi:hypothetical protein
MRESASYLNKVGFQRQGPHLVLNLS